MMEAMMLPKEFKKVLWRLEGMHGIVNDEVSRISCYEACKENKSIITHNQPVEKEKGRSQQHADHGRHHQAVLVAGELVMNAMNVILKLNLLLGDCIKMKKKTMD